MPPLRLAELMASLSLAMDLGTGQPLEWVMKCCLLGVRLAEALGLSEAERREVYYLALLRHIGCTAIASTTAEVLGDDLLVSGLAGLDQNNPAQLLNFMLRAAGQGQPPLQRAGTLARALATGSNKTNTVRAMQCEIAGQMAGTFGLGPQLQRDLWHLFERWDGRGYPKQLKGEAVALPVRVITLAQDAVTLHLLAGPDETLKIIAERSGKLYDPGIVEAFSRDAADLWPALAAESLWQTLLAAEPGEPACLEGAQLEEALQAVADFADLKSPHTLGHSRKVAELAAQAARPYGLSSTEAASVRHAGWLHDLGRVAVSYSIWNKPGPLSEAEWERVRLHPHYTERVLARSPALAPLGAVASLHHERLDGTGYHHHLAGGALAPAARLLAVADAYCAMTEARPHRPALTPVAAADELRREARAGRLDAGAVSAVLRAAGHRASATRPQRLAGLSEREIEVLRLLARGLSNPQIAAQLSISVRTAGHHVQHIYAKIGTSTRAGATLFALQHGLFD